MAMFNEQVAAQTKKILEEMRDPVGITFYTQEADCHPCVHVRDFLGELGVVEPRLKIETKDYRGEQAAAAATGIHDVPAMALRRDGEERAPVRYYGLPAGLEFGAFLKTLVLLGTGRGMEGVDAAAVAGIVKEANLKVFVLAA